MRRRGRPPYPDVLTPRQWQVLRLVREGMSNEQIALRLGISIDGVKFHVSEILGKLGVSSRNEAARWLTEGEQAAGPTASLRGGWRRQSRTQARPAFRAMAVVVFGGRRSTGKIDGCGGGRCRRRQLVRGGAA